MENMEHPESFYLGRLIESENGKLTENPFLYESKFFTTHAMCVGMTGSGKTGLGIALLEEAAMDNIPAIIIDPKGDLGNLMLAFPSLSANEFLPWIDPAEAEKKGKNIHAYAEEVAKTWKEGLLAWNEGEERIQKFKNAVETVIYTPASKAGIPLSILSSFTAPSKEIILDEEALRDLVMSTTSGLLGLLNINADPIKSREHILISTIIKKSWEQGKDLDIATLIQDVQTPPFTKVGVLNLDTFYPAKDRLSLSISLNNLLASPKFQAWIEGEPLDIQHLLYTLEGKPKLSIISIAHLSDAERMFFVTLLLNQVLAWMRRQSGTTHLRAMLYMDEIYGFFPPTSMPPSKVPMITLLKQARAFGLGIMLATQNPVDLDYKGLANCGTWFVGKLQTERDKARILEGLTIASNGGIQAKTLDKMFGLTGKRIFMMHSIYQKNPILFQTRWTLSYLRGPLTLEQIQKLDKPEKQIFNQKEEVIKNTTKPFLPAGLAEYFLLSKKIEKPIHYQPQVMGQAKLHFVDTKNKIDVWKDVFMIAPLGENGHTVNWEQARNDLKEEDLEDRPELNSTYDELPSGFIQKKNEEALKRDFAASLYQNQVLTIYRSAELKLNSKDGESQEAFSERVKAVKQEKQEEVIAALKKNYSEKIFVLTERARRAEEKMAIQKKQWWLQIGEATISFITTIIGALLGKGVTKGTITQTGASMRKAGRITKENQEASQAEENYNAIQQQLEDLKITMQAELEKAQQNGKITELDSFTIKSKKSDIFVERVALVWCP